jgi:amino-acid N-acetyltransferase
MQIIADSRIESVSVDAEVTALLKQAGLLSTDLQLGDSVLLFGCKQTSALLGTVGLELFGSSALLRSLAVSPHARGSGLGAALVTHALAVARDRGVTMMYLLTTTAAPFFARAGFETIAREQAPAAIKSTAQFSGLCPSSSTLIHLRLRSLQGTTS